MAGHGFWLAYYPLVYVGLVLTLRSRVANLPRSAWLDGLLGTLSFGAVGASVLMDRLLDGASTSTAALATSVAYPLGDLLLLGFVMALVASTGWRPTGALRLIVIAFALQVATDCAYLYQVAVGTFTYGGVTDLGWAVEVLLLGWAAWQPPRLGRRAAPAPISLAGLPSLFVALAIGVLMYASFVPGRELAAFLAAAHWRSPRSGCC